MIRVVIAGPTTRIVDDLDKLEPHREAIDVCGIARQASEILEEARLRQPDVLLLHDGVTELPLVGGRQADRAIVARNSRAAPDVPG